ncbi:hypothetical protein CR513_60439, partial [Mucuna pruriens]
MEEEKITKVKVEEIIEKEDVAISIKEETTTLYHIVPNKKSVCDKMSEEASSGRRPLIKYLRAFGCITYAYILNQLRKKLDNKGVKVVGYIDSD